MIAEAEPAEAAVAALPQGVAPETGASPDPRLVVKVFFYFVTLSTSCAFDLVSHEARTLREQGQGPASSWTSTWTLQCRRKNTLLVSYLLTV